MMTPALVVPINVEYVLPLLLNKQYIIAASQQGAVLVLNFEGKLQRTIERKSCGAAPMKRFLQLQMKMARCGLSTG
jgi:hypothetical protein